MHGLTVPGEAGGYSMRQEAGGARRKAQGDALATLGEAEGAP